MKTLDSYIIEKLHLNKDINVKQKYNYHPKDQIELASLIEELIKERGNEADLNDIDVSNVIDMSWTFANSKFNGDISKWDVSNVINMHGMFWGSEFNADISEWDVSNVKDMHGMFHSSKFNQDISSWDVSNVTDMSGMFYESEFNGDISKWDVSKVNTFEGMFYDCKQFEGNTLKKWININKKLSYKKYTKEMFKNNKSIPSWYKK